MVRTLFGWGPKLQRHVFRSKEQRKKMVRTGPEWKDISAFRTGLVDAPRLWKPKNAFRGEKAHGWFWTVIYWSL